ncbi:two-component regulator propeller domain-containing protein [Seongchinamella sediminis]|uniref:two-component regulator propeller domain-containing protein n=1 Tax=Seongchinamella sediminis TaxID=2283635 RepID=UPI001EF0479A|nr:two-component regulator propeller domain-containing protein [Seongchinamella sediminis]
MQKFGGSNHGDGSLGSTDIRGIGERKNGNLLIATFGQGIYEFSNEISDFTSVSQPSTIELKDLHTIAEDYFIASSKSGTVTLNLSDKPELDWLTSELSRAEISDVVGAAKIDDETTLLATNNSIVFIEFRSNSIVEQSLNLAGIDITAAAVVSAEEVYISTSDANVHRFNTKANQIESSLDLSGYNISSISDLLHLGDELWIATDRGLIVTSSELHVNSHLNQSNSLLSNNNITRLFYDGNVLFVGTFQGLDQIAPTSIQSFNNRSSNVDNDVLAFAQSEDGRIWVGTYNGIYVYSEGTKGHHRLHFPEGNGLPDNRITTLAVRDNELWAGLAKDGVHKIDILNGEVQSISASETTKLEVTKILNTGDDSIYLSTYNRGIYKAQGNSLVRIQSGGETSFNHLFETQTGTIFATSERHLYKLDTAENQFRVVKANFQQLNDHPVLLTLAETDDGRLLIGTKGHGIYSLGAVSSVNETLQLERFSQDPAIENATIYGMIFDNEFNLWCSTQSGIYKIDSGGKVNLRLTKLDGLQGDDFNYGSYFIDSLGYMYFGGLNGYSRIPADQQHLSNDNIPLKITQIILSHSKSLRSDEISELENLELTHDERSFAVVINLLDYQNPDDNQYTHTLEGLTDTWTEASTNNTVRFTGLDPGTYTFRARGANAAGVWSANEVALTIVVLPPWWKTWWAFGGYAMLAILMVWMIMRTYRSHLLKEEALRIAQEMHDAADQAQDDLQESHEYQDELVRAVSQHNLATLDLISQCLGDLNVEESGRAKLQGHIKALELLEQCYFFQEGQLEADMHTYVDGITNYLLAEATVDPATITSINRVTRETLPAHVASPLAVILYELLHNSMVHAFSPASHANFVETSIDVVREAGADPLLILVVADDGTGDNRAEGKIQGGSGRKVIQSLAAAMGASYSNTTKNGYIARLQLVLPDQ